MPLRQRFRAPPGRKPCREPADGEARRRFTKSAVRTWEETAVGAPEGVAFFTLKDAVACHRAALGYVARFGAPLPSVSGSADWDFRRARAGTKNRAGGAWLFAK